MIRALASLLVTALLMAVATRYAYREGRIEGWHRGLYGAAHPFATTLLPTRKGG